MVRPVFLEDRVGLAFGLTQSSETQRQSARVLVVEDEFIIAAGIQRSLQRIGHQVVGVCDSAEDLNRLLDEECADLILMDIELNGAEDGITAAEKLRESYNVPIVYISGLQREDIVSRIPETQPFGFVAKPFTDHQLSVAISIALYKAETERIIREREIHIQHLVEHMHQGFCLLDHRGYLRYANRQVLKNLGCSLDALKNAHVSQLLVEHVPDFHDVFSSGSEPRCLDYQPTCASFIATAEFCGREIECYFTPQFLYDRTSKQLQGCFISIIETRSVIQKLKPDVLD